MKIGILGNMNNMYFALARFLADDGYDCDLLVFDYEPEHFHPSADTFQEQINFTIKQLTWGDYGRFFVNRNQIENDLREYEFLIGNGTAPAFVNRIGRILDLFIPYGGDLYAFPFFRLVHPLKFISNLFFFRHQRKGILNCHYILFDKTIPEFEKVFRRLQYSGKRIICPPPLFYYKEYEEFLDEQNVSNPHVSELKKLRAENDLLILQHIRQFWKFHFDKWSRKANDQLIKGYAQFLKKNPTVKSKLLLFEYGLDVGHTKKLIKALDIEEHVTWFPKTLRKHLLLFIQTTDLVVGELRYSWNTYCVVMETLAMGKPIMHKRNDIDLTDVYVELYPMLHASSAQSVCDGLQDAVNNKTKMQEMGEAGKRWFIEYCVHRPLQHIKSIIAAKEKKVHA